MLPTFFARKSKIIIHGIDIIFLKGYHITEDVNIKCKGVAKNEKL